MSRLLFKPVLILLSVGLSACVSKSNTRADLVPLFMEQIRNCYTPPVQARGDEVPVLEVRLNLDGSLAQEPKVVRGNPDSLSAQAALKAMKRCAPFYIPESFAHRHTQWKVMQVAFEAK